YCLTYEEDTEFFLRHVRGEFREDPESDARFLETAMQMLEAAGFEHYEISNYARPGFESAHNRGYWAGDDYVGIGPSAFSTVEMGPEFLRHVHLRVGKLPKKKIRKPHFAGRADKQIGIGIVTRVEMLAEHVDVDHRAIDVARLDLAKQTLDSVDDFQPAAVT